MRKYVLVNTQDSNQTQEIDISDLPLDGSGYPTEQDVSAAALDMLGYSVAWKPE